MKMRLLIALAGLAISFALPTFAQQTNTLDPQLHQQLICDSIRNMTRHSTTTMPLPSPRSSPRTLFL